MKTPEDILSQTIAQQERDRLKALAKREKLERRKVPYTAYYGTDSATGQVRVKPLGSNGVVGVRSLSNSQPSMGQYGRGGAIGFDAGQVRRPRIEVFGKTAIDVKILASSISGGRRRFYLGGDLPAVREIFEADAAEEMLSAVLQNKSKNMNDWTLGIKTRLATGEYRIYTIFGDGTPTWSIVDRKCQALVYYGEGFWSGPPVEPLILFDNRYQAEEFLPYQGTQIKAFVIPPLGAGDIAATTTDTGIVQDPGPWTYTGTKSRIYTTRAERQLVTSSHLVGRNYRRRVRSLQTQCPWYKAFDGTLTFNAGTYTLLEDNNVEEIYDKFAPFTNDPVFANNALAQIPIKNLASGVWVNDRVEKPTTLEYPGAQGFNSNGIGDLVQASPLFVVGPLTIYRSLSGPGRVLNDFALATAQYFLIFEAAETELTFSSGLPGAFRFLVGQSLPQARTVDTGSTSIQTALTQKLACTIYTELPSAPSYDLAAAPQQKLMAHQVRLPSGAIILGVY